MSDAASASTPLLRIEGLTVAFGSKPVVEDLSFEVRAGRTLGVIGESGSGKSVTALSVMRLADLMGAAYRSGRILFDGRDGEVDLLARTQKEMRRVRGKEISMIFQEPMTSLNPIFTIGDQIAEALALHEGMDRAAALAEAGRLLEMVRLPDSRAMLRRYPHQLSGGMRQRAMIAMALACKPKLLIADEPTTALDVTIQAQILSIMRDLQAELGMTLVFITHDMGVVAEMADDVVVMRSGRKVEDAAIAEIFRAPRHPYTRALLAAVPRLGSMAGERLPRQMPLPGGEAEPSSPSPEPPAQDTAHPERPPLLSVRDMTVRFDVRRSFLGRVTHRVHAVERVSFDIHPGETLALVGESGSGKSTIGRTVQQLLAATGGDFLFEGTPFSAMRAEERRRLQERIQYIFQDPFASLDPRRTVGFSIAEPILTHELLRGEASVKARVAELLAKVGLDPGCAGRYPHEFSGGQRQRVCIARALAPRPKLIIADEPLSSMDVSIQAQIINLFMELQRQEGLSYLFISHDMAVVERMSHRVAVLYLGQIVEYGSRGQVFEDPRHPYTQRLLSAVPVADPGRRRGRVVPDGEIRTQIRRAGDEPELVSLTECEPGHFVA